MIYIYFANVLCFGLIVWLTILSWRGISAVSVGVYFGLVFLALNIPKYVFIKFFGVESLDIRIVLNYAGIDSIDIGFFLIQLFICILLGAYYFSGRKTKHRTDLFDHRYIHPVYVQQNLSYLILLPLSLAGTAFVVAYLNLGSAENLFQKVKLLNEDAGGSVFQYVLFKAAQFVKIIFYVYLVALVSGQTQRPAFKVAALVSLSLSLMLFFFVSQRSGMFLILLDMLFAYAVINKINWKYLIVGASLFVVANVLLLAGRAGVFEIGPILESVFLRRYFFDVEKVALIFDYVDRTCNSSVYLSDVFFTCTDYSYLGENIHLFVGDTIFGKTGLGIPPNIIGETILRFGSIPLVFVAVSLGYILRKIEVNLWLSKDPLHKVALIIILVRAVYFLSSSDFRGMIFRIGFDLVVLYSGWYFYKVTGHMKTAKAPRAPRPARSRVRRNLHSNASRPR